MLTGRKILLADDSLTIQKVVSLTFGDEGCVVVCVGDGAAALEKMEEIEPDIVLADVFMPGLNGYELCQRIKQNERFKRVPVILLIGTFEPFNEEEARRVGANEVLTKPFQSIRELVGKVGNLLSVKPEEEQTAEKASREAATLYADSSMDDEMIEATSVREQTMARAGYPSLQPPVEASAPAAVSHPSEAASSNAANGVAAMPQSPHESSRAEIPVVDASEKQPAPEIAVPDAAEPAIALFPVLEHQVSSSQNTAPASEAATPEPVVSAQTAQSETWDDDVLELDEESFAPTANDGYILEIEEETVEPAFAEAEEEPSPEFEPSTIGAAVAAGVVAPSHFAPVEDVSQSIAQEPMAGSSTPQEMPIMPMMQEATIAAPAPETAQPSAETAQSSPEAAQASAGPNISPELVEAVARRVVELMSSKVVEEIAWEVVPQLSELIIKRKLEGGKI